MPKREHKTVASSEQDAEAGKSDNHQSFTIRLPYGVEISAVGKWGLVGLLSLLFLISRNMEVVIPVLAKLLPQ